MKGCGDTDSPKAGPSKDSLNSSSPVVVDASKLFHDKKSFCLDNSISNSGPLLGIQEMEKYLDGKLLRLQITTWNMGSLPIPSEWELRKLFYHDQDETMKMVDIHVVAVQECWPDSGAWELALQTCLGPGFAIMTSEAFGTLHISIILRRDLLWFVTDINVSNQVVRPPRLFKTKGASAIQFGFFGSKFLFITAHLSAGNAEANLFQRKEELRKILDGEQNKYYNHLDGIFLAGDLNFRINGLKREEIFEYLKRKQLSPILEHDELNEIFRQRNTIPKFLEDYQEACAITFRPTYKYDIGTDIFDTSNKKRSPAYTDRILYRGKEMLDSNSNIECFAYEAVTNFRVSDHKPVYALFGVQLKPGQDTLPLSGCQFLRDIYIKGVQARAKYLLERKKKLDN